MGNLWIIFADSKCVGGLCPLNDPANKSKNKLLDEKKDIRNLVDH